ncbi:prepilin-type N-terminal cleavage/methylation domain-containing protein [Neobacillus sp. NPDC093127]|uniref:prepilin-type N-terminal cleavage/methylation domain-containing protein n=1 Tax=Neobacillus sp. NPDC093127 TaxID=3364296 RepID=UPI0037FEBA66
MLQSLKNKIKDQRGLTLIELLAVIVILGIIAAIAIPSIMGLIDNSKKDAHVSNAIQMVNSVKTAVSADKSLIPADESNPVYLSLDYLLQKGYIEDFKDPDTDGNYVKGTYTESGNDKTVLTVKPTDVSYVKIEKVDKTLVYSVQLIGNERKILEIPSTDLERSKVE